jgi:hypothetical protein
MFGPTVNFMPFDYNVHFDGYPVTAHNLQTDRSMTFDRFIRPIGQP